MRIIIAENYEKMSQKAAGFIASQMILQPTSILGLATGSTPIGTYQKLIELNHEGVIDFSKIKTFNLDEYLGISPENTQSYYHFMQENLFNHINIKSNQTHVPNGQAQSIEAECLSYEKAIQDAGGIDLQLLGIGSNGHIGFNEPSEHFEAITHKVKLTQETIEANSRFFEKIDDVPTEAVSMGTRTIMRARKVLLVASGASKSQAVLDALCGPITPQSPASILQLHPDVTFILDVEAASLLDHTLGYDFSI